MGRRSRRALLLLGLAGLAAALAAVGQEAILTFSLDEESIEIRQGGEAIAVLRVENGSIYASDAIEPTLDAAGISLHAEPEEIEVLAPFDSAAIVLRLTASDDVPLGSTAHALGIVYSYCIGELCYQFAEEIPFTVTVEPPSVVPVEDPIEVPIEIPTAGPAGAESALWVRLAVVAVGLLLAAAAAVVHRLRGVRWPAVAIAVLFTLGGLAYGVLLDQHEQAQGIGAVLCTSCVGIEVAQHGEPELTPEGIAAVERIEREIELLVFFAEWCHACPYAERMVEAIASHNPRIVYRFVDVEAEPELAERSGVVRSGRTVVPAVLRVDTGDLVFGAEDLEARLLELLEGEP